MYVSAKAVPILGLAVSGLGSYVINQISWNILNYLIFRIMKARSAALEPLINDFKIYSKFDKIKPSIFAFVYYTKYLPELRFGCPHNEKDLFNFNPSKPYCIKGQQTCWDYQQKIFKRDQPFYMGLSVLHSIRANSKLIGFIIGIASSAFSIRIVLSRDAYLITKVTTVIVGGVVGMIAGELRAF